MGRDARGASEVSVDGCMWRGRVGTTGNQGRSRPRNILLVRVRNRRQGWSAPESAPMGRLPGECRIGRRIERERPLTGRQWRKP